MYDIHFDSELWVSQWILTSTVYDILSNPYYHHYSQSFKGALYLYLVKNELIIQSVFIDWLFRGLGLNGKCLIGNKDIHFC